MDPDDSRLIHIVAATREYCELIENMDTTDCFACMSAMARVLPRLQQAAEKLPRPDGDSVHTGTPEFDARFELFSRIHGALGKLDSYRMEFDHPEHSHDNSGSLADDFTDMYFDLRYGLDLLDTQPDGPGLAAASWKTSYDLHWHEHLAGARRQLTEIIETYGQG